MNEKFSRNLAIDVNSENVTKAILYSEMIQEVFGSKTFSIADLESTLDLFAPVISCVSAAFSLPNATPPSNEEISKFANFYKISLSQNLQDTIKSIAEKQLKDISSCFLTESKISCMEAELKRLKEDNERILSML